MSERVFAFGSNMCSGRFLHYFRRHPALGPQGPGQPALLRDYRLCFNKESSDGSGKGNVELHPGGEVWGVVYSIPDAGLPVLDAGEGPGYRREKKQLELNGKSEDAWVYMAVDPSREPGLIPYTWYKRFLVEGAKEHNLPPHYTQALELIQAKEDDNKQRDREKRALSCP